MTNPIPTWRETLGNSPTLVAAGAVGQAMQQEIDLLRVRLSEVEKDAARYQWLREQNALLEDFTFYVGQDAGPDEGDAVEWVGSDLDAAIDAAMGAQALGDLGMKVEKLEAEATRLRAELTALREQKPFAWYDPSSDKFTRDLDDPSMNRGAVLWRLFLDAQPSAERPCPTCAHFKQGSKPLVGVYDADCFECKHYYASKWEKKP